MALFQSDGESASCGVESMEIDLGHNSHSPCAVLMELAEGRSLQDRTLSEDELRRYVHDILQGLEHIHNYNCMHLDIKPANIFLSDETGGTAMIGDFGQLVSYDSYKPHCIQEGDKRYLAPELLGDVVPPIHAPDIFSLAVSILECATNLEIPQHGEAYQMLRSEQFPEAFMSTLSPSLQDMLRKMLRRDPEARPTAKELLNEPFFATLPPSLPTTARRKKSRSTSSPSTPLMITSAPFSVASSAPAHHFMTAHPRPFGYYGAQPSSAHDDSAMAAPVCRRIDFGGS
jgi:serine/threonine protein kinase